MISPQNPPSTGAPSTMATKNTPPHANAAAPGAILRPMIVLAASTVSRNDTHDNSNPSSRE